jgi:hypothetical protein
LACGGAAAAGGVHGSPHGAWSSRVMAACSVSAQVAWREWRGVDGIR